MLYDIYIYIYIYKKKSNYSGLRTFYVQECAPELRLKASLRILAPAVSSGAKPRAIFNVARKPRLANMLVNVLVNMFVSMFGNMFANLSLAQHDRSILNHGPYHCLS